MNKLENPSGAHRFIVLPLQTEDHNHFNGVGLTLHFLLGNTIATNTYLKEFWFGWRVAKLFSDEQKLEGFNRGKIKLLNLKQLSREQNVRFWLSGQVVGNHSTLYLYDGDDDGPVSPRTIAYSFDDDLIGFRKTFIQWLEECGLPYAQVNRRSALWPEKINLKAANVLGRALERFYIYSAYGHSKKGPIDLTLFEEAVESSPQSFMSQNLLGWAYYRNENYDHSKQAFLRALQENPVSPGAMSGLMWCGVYTNNEEEALYWTRRKASVMNKDLEGAQKATLAKLKKIAGTNQHHA